MLPSKNEFEEERCRTPTNAWRLPWLLLSNGEQNAHTPRRLRLNHFSNKRSLCWRVFRRRRSLQSLISVSPADRLAYHKKHSLPIMKAIKKWGKTHLDNKTVEEHSGLAKAIRYFNNHYESLVRFCEIEGVMRDNNRIESLLKIVVRDRKNVQIYKTQNGATVDDIITSMIATGSQAGVNVFEYFTMLQKNRVKERLNPENYLPWNYQEQI
jgi:hypothetical protein